MEPRFCSDLALYIDVCPNWRGISVLVLELDLRAKQHLTDQPV